MLPATDLHPDVAAKQANSAIEDGESSELEKYTRPFGLAP